MEVVLKMTSGRVPDHTGSMTGERSLKVRKEMPNQSAMNSAAILLSQMLQQTTLPLTLPSINQKCLQLMK